ncbi:hypothetical protein GQ53DRAFT_784319 [Thozetella sp. PMI_491]|nr:hypothetical protein GQ53DRAFT_784319 [Thozetella sp. PMI_491]
MPCFRGISVSFTTQADNATIPEYPHPEGSSISLPCPRDLYRDRRTSSSADSQAHSTFVINYEVIQMPQAPCKFLFFKLYMNSRQIASWGIDPKLQRVGCVAKSLWAPSNAYGGQVGIESRNFLFLPGQENKSVADDGGLIEVQVFRARDKSARAPRLDQFRHQDKYGIAAPSMGLLAQPEQAYFYQWLLMDPKDAPYATFRYHYRSWTNLRLLNLIPEGAKPPSFLFETQSISEYHPARSEEHEKKEVDFAIVPRDEATINDSAQYSMKQPPALHPVPSMTTRIPQPSKVVRDRYTNSYLQRPLPQLPLEEVLSVRKRHDTEPLPSPKRSSGGSRCSAASASSGARSLTASLKDYVDMGDLDEDEVELGEAKSLQVIRCAQKRSTISSLPEGDDLSEAAAAVSILSSTADSSSDVVSAVSGTSSTQAKPPLHMCSLSREALHMNRRNISPKAKKLLGVENDEELDIHRPGAVHSAEPSWMRRTPSPIRNLISNPAANIWSPHLPENGSPRTRRLSPTNCEGRETSSRQVEEAEPLTVDPNWRRLGTASRRVHAPFKRPPPAGS